MSLIFKPKINFSFEASKLSNVKVKTVHRELNPWSTKELKQLVELKALGLSYATIAPILKRSVNNCGTTMSTRKLVPVYKKRRMEMIEEVMGDDYITERKNG
jgi:hypothetical protein